MKRLLEVQNEDILYRLYASETIETRGSLQDSEVGGRRPLRSVWNYKKAEAKMCLKGAHNEDKNRG